ncbi:MAG: acyl-CoA thioesterase [Desulfatibacillaceae bacterium]
MTRSGAAAPERTNEAGALPGHEVRMTVPFHDLDPLQVVWHGNYMKYFDIARQALFDSLEVDLYDIKARFGYVFPIIRQSVKHSHPLRHRDEFLCRARLVQAARKIVVEFEVRLVDGTLCARAVSEQAAVRVPDGKLCLKVPEPLAGMLQKAMDRAAGGAAETE